MRLKDKTALVTGGYLAADESAFASGAEFRIDGGSTI